jgi:general secretion pathway protein D
MKNIKAFRSMNSRTIKSRALLLMAAVAAMLAACASPIKQADEYAAQDEWMRAVLEYRKAYGKEPQNVEYKSRLKQTELKAADFYYQRGMRLVEQGSLDAAIVQFQQGLAAMPDHSKLLQAMNETLARKEANNQYQEGISHLEAGRTDEARRKLRGVLEAYPDHKEAREKLAEIEKEMQTRENEGLVLTSKAPVTLNFRQTELRTAFEFLAKSFGINVIFDESFKSVPVTLFAKDVTFEQGLNLLLNTTKTFYKKIGPNTILVAPDSKDKRGQYEDHVVRTFQLNTITAKEMADILKGLLTIKKIIVNESLNTIIIRDVPDVIVLAEKIIEANDRKPAEIIIEVEILEVNRNKAEKLGLDLGTYAFTASVPSTSTINFKSSIRSQLRDVATLTVPSVTFRFYKQDVDAKTLANPKIRVMNGKSAKILIGDRIPLRSTTIVDATGQTRTTYEYKDVGIRLTADPIIHLDNSVNVKLSLEVSSLGENLGTQNDPAFRIGTRSAETFMLLRDGETAILGGLIRDEERNTRVKIPGLGDIPVIGALFTSYDDSAGRTDVLLTITPRVVRGWESPGKLAREFYSGSENNYSDKPLFAQLDTVATAGGVAVQPRIETSGVASAPGPNAPGVTPSPANKALGSAPATAVTPAPTGPLASSPQPPVLAAPALLTFSEPVYEAASEQDIEIKLVGQNLSGATALPMEILYNPQLLNFVRGEKGEPLPQSFSAETDATRGVIKINVNYASDITNKDVVLARIIMRGVKPGISYLVCRTPSIRSASGETLNAQVRASRILVR